MKQPRLSSSSTPPHLLAIRFQDGDHSTRFPALRRITFKGQRYRLTGLYLGSRKCGHQIGMASPDGNWRHWAVADADLHKDWIGPVHICFTGNDWDERSWWKVWKELVHATKYGFDHQDLCQISPHNPEDTALDQYKGTARKGSPSGTVSLDFVYMAA